MQSFAPKLKCTRLRGHQFCHTLRVKQKHTENFYETPLACIVLWEIELLRLGGVLSTRKLPVAFEFSIAQTQTA